MYKLSLYTQKKRENNKIYHKYLIPGAWMGQMRNSYKFQLEELTRGDHFGKLCVDGKKILKQIFDGVSSVVNLISEYLKLGIFL